MNGLIGSVVLASAAAGGAPNPWMILPFGLLLLSIAVFPLVASHFWEKYYNWVAVGLGCVTLCYYVFVLKDFHSVEHSMLEYISFIALIGSLFVVSGGIHVGVKGNADPLANVGFLALGSILSNLIGTTGASMLMIRPWIRMNRSRISGYHIVFFIFIVSNISGALTPIGDPPLFLGYLRGVPFFWTLTHCWAGWVLALGILLVVFFLIDLRSFKKATKREFIPFEDTPDDEKFFVHGLVNLLFLGVILGAVFLPSPWREGLMILAAVGSYFTTNKKIHEANNFNFAPIKEVAWLFVGIFLTMIPALAYLKVNAGAFGIDTPMKFFWSTGALSGVLDNAPTYLTFLATAMGVSGGMDVNVPEQVLQFTGSQGTMLLAISLGAVFFGSMTYIGNGPNFMVKSIADQAKIQTPTFFGYIVKYSVPILVPVFLVVGILLFSKWAIF